MSKFDLAGIPEEILQVADRAQRAAWEIEWTERPEGEEQPTLIISVPNGRDRRRLVINSTRARRLVVTPFEQCRILGGYLAINNSSESYIEVLPRPYSRTLSRYSIYDIPGIEILEPAETPSTANDDGDVVDEAADSEPSTEREAIHAGARWRLKIEDNRHSWRVEFSEASEVFRGLISDPRIMVMRNQRSPATMKIYGIDAPQHDEALRRLEDIGGAVLFDLDLCYGLQLELGHYIIRTGVRPYVPERMTRSPLFPRLRYSPEALSLYSYGRSASGMPLLQFLAYYQVLEFFFPMYFRQHLLKRLRQELTDPRFDVTDDAHLARLMNTMSSSRTGYGNERDQLKATINGCVDDATMHDFLQGDPDRLRLLADKKVIRDVPAVVDDGHHGNLIDQVSERIYAIRCRVVHAKADGGDAAVDLLLPGGPEALSLVTDIGVMQFLAQKAIVAGATPLS